MQAIISILFTILIGLVSYLFKLALSDRDAKIKKLQEEVEKIEEALNKEKYKIVVLETSYGTILSSINKLEYKLDKILEK